MPDSTKTKIMPAKKLEELRAEAREKLAAEQRDKQPAGASESGDEPVTKPIDLSKVPLRESKVDAHERGTLPDATNSDTRPPPYLPIPDDADIIEEFVAAPPSRPSIPMPRPPAPSYSMMPARPPLSQKPSTSGGPPAAPPTVAKQPPRAPPPLPPRVPKKT